MDPQPHPLLHFLVQNDKYEVFLRIAKNVVVTREKICTVQRMLKRFPAKSLKLIPHQINSMRMGIIMQKDDSVWQHSRAFWLYGVLQFLQGVCIALYID